MLLLRIGLHARDVVLVRWRRVLPIESIISVAPDADRIIRTHRARGFDRGTLPGRDEIVIQRLEIFQRLCLFCESNEMSSPQRGKYRFRALSHLRVDEGRVISLAELRPLLVDDLDIAFNLLDVFD